MTGTPTLSIALATYNGERYLGEQLRSYAHQTRLPDELVVTDDGSTDRTIEVIEEFARTAPFPVRIHRNERNLGFRDNFLKAASLCSGEFVSYSDQDDFWLPTKIEKSLARLRQDGADLCIHTAHIGDENLKPVGLMSQDISQNRVIGPLHVLPMPGRSYGFTITFRRSLLDIVDPALRPHQPQEGTKVVYHDLWVYLMAFVFGRISELNEPLAIYRQHRHMTSSGAQNAPPPSREVPLHQYEFRAEFAGQCAAALEAAVPSLAGEARQKAERGAIFCRTFEANVRERIRIYRHRSPLGRARSYARLVWSGAYQAKQRGGLGQQSALKDFVLGVLSLGRIAESRPDTGAPSTTAA